MGRSSRDFCERCPNSWLSAGNHPPFSHVPSRGPTSNKEKTMRNRTLFTFVAALFVSLSAFAADLTVDEILAKNFAAMGGTDKLQAMKSVRFTGKMSMGGMEASVSMTKKRPE